MQIHRIARNSSSAPAKGPVATHMSNAALDPGNVGAAVTSCPHCGFAFGGEYRNCGNCGKALAATAKRVTPAEPHDSAQPTEPLAGLSPRLRLRALAMIPRWHLRCGWR